jgi:CII-binding regulator of phage lambda lysogenization HflD
MSSLLGHIRLVIYLVSSLFYKRLFLNLTPLIPLSILGEGEENLKEGLTPLLNTPMIQAHYQGRKILRYAVKFASFKGRE